ncbi:hypothetical protein KKC32_01760 [Patescibacteria group bacterium]|nr:hypothetical protein [Patescibacteria group bacterium]
MNEFISKHSCDNLVLTCMDFRFRKDIYSWLEENGYAGNYDLISLAGAQKSIVDEDTRGAVMKQVGISHDLHHAKRVILMAHQDCGAYGGSKAFDSLEQENQKYNEEMKTAEAIIKEKYPEMEVMKLLLSFNENGEVSFNEM